MRVELKENEIRTNMDLAIEVALATAADCFHGDESLDEDEVNGFPAYSGSGNFLTGRIQRIGLGLFVEMDCPQCKEKDWHGDEEYFADHIIVLENEKFECRYDATLSNQ